MFVYVCLAGCSIWTAALNVARVCKHQQKPFPFGIPFGKKVRRRGANFVSIYPTHVRKEYGELMQADIDRYDGIMHCDRHANLCRQLALTFHALLSGMFVCWL